MLAISLKEIKSCFSIHEHVAQFNNTPMSFEFQITSLRQRGIIICFSTELESSINTSKGANKTVDMKTSNKHNIGLFLYYYGLIRQSSVMFSSTRMEGTCNCYQRNNKVKLHVNHQALE